MKPIAFIAPRFPPVIVSNAAILEGVVLSIKGEDEVAGKDDSFVVVFQSIGQADSLACEEVADVELEVAAHGIAVFDGDTATEGSEFVVAGGHVGLGRCGVGGSGGSGGVVVEEGVRGRCLVGDEEERSLGGEVGRRRREESPVCAAGGAEGEEIL